MIRKQQNKMEIRKKSWPDYFKAIVNGEKKIDVRLADFECNQGDVLVFEEWDPKTKKYTGKKIKKKVGNIIKTKDLKFWSKEEMDKNGLYVIQLED